MPTQSKSGVPNHPNGAIGREYRIAKIGRAIRYRRLGFGPDSCSRRLGREILEEFGLGVVGTHGTVAALAVLNDAVKKGGVMACSHVGGLSGSFIPVSEDHRMIEAAAANQISLDMLLAMTAICSVGLDMIAIPGNTPATTIAAMIADEAAIGVQNNKTTAVRVIPAIGCGVGDFVEFGGLLGRAPVQPVHEESSADFINRGGRSPAPIHSFKN